MSRNVYDVIVVGAGPGGATLAAKLAQAGFRVLLLDKAQFPRYKVCGGGVTQRALLKMPVDISPVIRQSINTLEVAYKNGRYQVFNHKRPFMVTVIREELDFLLARHAVACGAELKMGAFVQKVVEKTDVVMVCTQEETYRGRYLVGADGVNSLVARQVGLMRERRKALAVECEIETHHSLRESYARRVLIDYGRVENGYAWLFPKTTHLSVGVGSFSLNYAELSVLLQDFIASSNLNGRVLSTKGSFLSVGGKQETIITARVALLGDAAGLVDSFTGEGIYYALWSAELLSVRLKECLIRETQTLANYQADVNQFILPELQTLDRIGRSFYGHTQLINFLVGKFPQLLGLACESFEGKRSYQSLATVFQRFGRVKENRPEIKWLLNLANGDFRL